MRVMYNYRDSRFDFSRVMLLGLESPLSRQFGICAGHAGFSNE